VTGADHQISGNTIRNNGVPSWESAQLTFFTAYTNASGCSVQNNTVSAMADQSLFMVLNGKSTLNDDPHDIDLNSYTAASLTSFCWNNDYTCDQLIDFESWQLAPDGDTVADQDVNSTFTLDTSPPVDTTIPGSDLPGISQSLVPEEDKTRRYIDREIPGPDDSMQHFYIPVAYELEITEMDIIDDPHNVEAMLAGKFWNGNGYIVSLGLRHSTLSHNMYIAIPMADPWNGWPILFHQGPGETEWQRDTGSRIVGSTADAVLVRVNTVGLFTAVYMTPVLDNDGDSYSVADGDCNDDDPEIYPGHMEICDNQADDNCDGRIDENCIAIETVLVNGLEWQKTGHPGQFTQAQADTYCSTLGGPGSIGWRLPSKEELKDLVVCTNETDTPLPDGETCGTGYLFPTIDPEFSCFNSNYWTGTAEESDFWMVSFYTGSADTYNLAGKGNVRCVRTP